MSDDYTWRPRVHLDPSDDAGAGGAPQRPAFQFDLGGALARLGDPAAPAAPEIPAPAARQARDETPSDGLVRPYATPRSSVFEDLPMDAPAPASAPPEPTPQEPTPRATTTTTAPAPTPCPTPQAAPVPQPAPAPPARTTFAPTPSVFDVPAAPAAPAAHTAPADPAPSLPSMPMRAPGATAPLARASVTSTAPPVFSSAVVSQAAAPAEASGGVMLAEPPTLTDPTVGAAPFLPPPTPASVAVPTPAKLAEQSTPSLADVKAFKAAQMRASRQQRKGKVFGRTVLVLAALGAIVGAALYFGRSYLFPAEWDPELVSVVEELEVARGAELERTVPLVVQPADEYAITLTGVIGDTWQDRLPQWRALGLAGPGVTPEAVGAALAARLPAFYDAETDTIYRSTDVDPATLTPELRLALGTAFAEQADAGVVVETPALGFAGLSSPQRLAERSVDSHLAGRSGVVVAGAELPVPIAYEVAVVDSLGESILLSVGADPAAVGFGTYPDAIYGALSDEPALAPAVPLQTGETALADAVALGVDDWSLVWATQLREPTVEQLARLVTADSYRPIQRGDVVCAVGTFQTGTEAEADTVLGALQNWSVLAPTEAQATAIRTGPNQVQLVSCDPGNSAVAPDLAIVDQLIARQSARLAG